MYTLRDAAPDDLNFFVWIDIKDEGSSSSYMASWEDAAWARHRAEMAAFLAPASPERFAFVVERAGDRIAGLCGQIERLDPETSWLLRAGVPAAPFPADGRYAAIFQLWVDAAHRRRGLGTRLKQRAEAAALERGVRAIYTHTESSNAHVLMLNQRLGYREIWRGPMWDAHERVSLLKLL